MTRLIVALLSLVVCTTRPVFAADYVLKLETTTDAESTIGDGKPVTTSDVRTLELLITPERRFRGRTTWEDQRLTVKGKMTEEKDGTLKFEIDCGHFVKWAPPGKRETGNPVPDIENGETARVTLGVTPGKPVIIGSMVTNQTTGTPQGNRNDKRAITFRLTIVEDDGDE
jgi:hypothetical protein